jgi:F0F1-type ATP synthase membrane subunit b/b'
MASEEERLKDQTARTLSRMRFAAGQEIESASKQARRELRSYAAELALKLARREIRDRMSPRVAAGLVDGFVAGLDRVERKVK